MPQGTSEKGQCDRKLDEHMLGHSQLWRSKRGFVLQCDPTLPCPQGKRLMGSWPSGEKLWFVGNSGAFCCCCCCLVLPLWRFLFVVFWLVLLFEKRCLSLDWWLTCQRRPSKVATAALDTEVKVLGFTCLYYHLISFLVIAADILAFAVMVTSSILNDIAMPLADNQVFSFRVPSHA